MNLSDRIEGCFLGLAIGDALGVPVEFSDRKVLSLQPVIDMRGHGVWNQPPGTWSDDSSLAFCLAESLCNGYDLAAISKLFTKWMQEGYWGAHYKVFDVGNTTRNAINRLTAGELPIYSGDIDEDSNGNGSLMRVTPASIFFHRSIDEDLMERMREVSGITHRHFRSVFSCFIFSKVIKRIILGSDKVNSYKEAIAEADAYINTQEFDRHELGFFKRILDGSLVHAKADMIGSSGYVLHTLEASLWCFLNSDSYRTSVLKAVNLGGDTDTTGCVTGALAGLYYGADSIPVEWSSAIARYHDIVTLSKKFVAVSQLAEDI